MKFVEVYKTSSVSSHVAKDTCTYYDGHVLTNGPFGCVWKV